MSTFELAISVVLKHEGLLVNDATDPGGITNYGISLRFLRTLDSKALDGFMEGDLDHDGDIDSTDIRDMTLEQAMRLYRIAFWDKYGYSRINDQALATKVFDTTVNMGAKQSHALLQRSCWAINGYECIKDDGVLGSATLTLINTIKPLLPMRSECGGFYRSLISAKPELNKYATGWAKRAYS